MNRRDWLGVFLMAPAAGWVGCSGKRAAGTASRLRVSANPHLSMSGLYLAQELGYFAQAGLTVELRQIPNAVLAVPLLASSKLDVAFSALSPSFINAIAKGAHLRIVAGREIASPTCGSAGAVYGNRKAFPQGLANPRQLKGKRIAVNSRAGFSGFCLDVLLASAGLGPGEVRIVELRRSEASAALSGGQIDALLANDFDKDPVSLSPQVVRGVEMAQVLPNFQFSHVMFGERLLAGDPAIGASFLSAYLRGAQEFLRSRTPRFLEDHARAYGLDPKLAQAACRETFTPDGTIQLENLQYFIDWAVRKGYCPRPIRAAQLVDTRFLDRAHGRSPEGNRPEPQAASKERTQAKDHDS